MKICFKCSKRKPLDAFYRHSRMADGHLNKCKSCTKQDVSRNYQSKRDFYAEYERKRFQRPARKAAALAYQRDLRKRNPGKYKARTAVGNALRDGRLSRKPCKVCGMKAQAHHKDYRKPLEVEWLCRLHHLKEHGKKAF